MGDEKFDKTQLRSVTARDLSALFVGTSPEWWQARFSHLRELGVLSQRGKKHFGTIDAIERWLTDGAE